VLDTGVDSEGRDILSYRYTIAGVDYETVQRLDDDQLSRKEYYLPGSRVDLRYDPRHPTNSVVV
jgi:hypothetical protein